MGASGRRRADRALRAPMRSPGRPPVARREHRQRFWEAIAGGSSSEGAAVAAGVSPAVGTRWFREGGGMPTVSPARLSGRFLSFVEREEVAVLHAQGYGSAKPLGGWAGLRRRSRGSCAAMLRPVAVVSSIGPRPPTGTP